MRKNLIKNLDLQSSGMKAALFIIAFMFLIGEIAGCLLANRTEGEGKEALTAYLYSFINAVQSGTMIKPTFASLLWKTIRWPFLAFLIGFTPLGMIGIPMLCMLRAFLLSFTVSSFFRILGTSGLLLSISIFGITGLFCIPILFVLSTQSFLNAGAIIGQISGDKRNNFRFNHSNMLCVCICFLFLFICALIEFSLSKSLLITSVGVLN